MSWKPETREERANAEALRRAADHAEPAVARTLRRIAGGEDSSRPRGQTEQAKRVHQARTGAPRMRQLPLFPEE